MNTTMKIKDVEGSSRLCVDTQLEIKLFRGINLGDLQSEAGYTIKKDGSISSWFIEGSFEQEGRMVFYGPQIQGEGFSLKKLNFNKISLIAHFFSFLLTEKQNLKRFYTQGLFFTNQGDLMVLPLKLLQFLNKNQNEDNRKEGDYPFNHPEKEKEAQYSFILGVLSYYLLTSEFPYNQNLNEEERYQEFCKTKPIPLNLFKPTIKEEITNLIMQSLWSKNEHFLNLDQWKSLLKRCQEGDIFNDQDQLSIEKAQSQLIKIKGKKAKALKQKRFWRKRGIVVLISTAILLILGIIAYTPIKRSLEPPLTINMSAQEVVEAYYSSFDSFDQDLLEDTIDKTVGKGDISEVTNIFVTSRVRLGYEGKTGILPAKEWKAQGMVLPERGTTVYGITDLKIENISKNQFQAKYEKWSPGTSDDIDDMESAKPIAPDGYRVTDTLTLSKQKKGNWLITELKRDYVPLQSKEENQ